MIKSLLFALFFSQVSHALPVPGLLGSWTAENLIPSGNVDFQVSFDFQQDFTDMTIQCLFHDGAILQAQTQALTNYSNNEIYIQEKRQSVVDDGFHFCRATLQPARWTAYFDGTGRMILFLPTPYDNRLSLVRHQLP